MELAATKPKKQLYKYPVIDLFAGPGGLGEGFSQLKRHGKPIFSAAESFENDQYAYKTLVLRKFYRSFSAPDQAGDYYRYLSNAIEYSELKKKYPKRWEQAMSTTWKHTLGENHDGIKSIITNRLNDRKKWVLVGGPPCQAYSLVGRSRRANDPDFEKDKKHFLYKEYLKIIVDHKPPIFVMENVKGLLSARTKGGSMLQKILRDLSKPISAIKGKKNGLSYRLYSLTEKGEFSKDTDPTTFIVKAEKYGIPQARHRVIIIGVRSDINVAPQILEEEKGTPSVKEMIDSLPSIRSGISGGSDSYDKWRNIIKETIDKQWFKKQSDMNISFAKETKKLNCNQGSFPKDIHSKKLSKNMGKMREWFSDANLTALTCHESRTHMKSDIERYLFASTYSMAYRASPKLADFPEQILPLHKNVMEGVSGKKFPDRFRVQLPDRVSTTVTSHISKDGHYFIHYNPKQCRSLTVREAARLQTFPDNFHFEGPRTAQYHQVGNAVPPFLAYKIARIVSGLLAEIDD